MYLTTAVSSPVGEITLATGDGRALTGLWLEGQRYFGGSSGEKLCPGQPDLPAFQCARDWLERYFAGERPAMGEIPLAPWGTPFQRAVWDLLCQIPYGTVTTYGALAQLLARQLGRPVPAPRAVGSAVGRNPISILIPCHRVVGAGGSLTGYAGGLDRKRWLLEHEGADLKRFVISPRTSSP